MTTRERRTYEVTVRFSVYGSSRRSAASRFLRRVQHMLAAARDEAVVVTRVRLVSDEGGEQ